MSGSLTRFVNRATKLNKKVVPRPEDYDFCDQLLNTMDFNKNTILGLVLMLALAFGVSWYNAKEAQETAQQEATAQTAQPKTTTPAQKTNTPSATTVANADKINQYGVFGSQANLKPAQSILENDKIKVTIDHKGATIRSVELKDDHYKTYWGKKNISFWDAKSQSMFWSWNDLKKGQQGSWQYVFNATSVSKDVQGNSHVTLELNNNQGQKFAVTYTLTAGSNMVQCQIASQGLQNNWSGQAGSFQLNWQTEGLHNEKGIQAERSRSSVFYAEMDKDRSYLSENGGDEKQVEGRLNWAAFKQNYFTAAVISPSGFLENAKLNVITPAEDTLHTKVYRAELPIDLSTGQSQLNFFFGPNEQTLLADTQVNEFDHIIDYGWGIIGWVNKYAIRPLFWLLSSWIGSFGIIILIVTLVIKMVLFPITWKNLLNGAKMRAIKPEIDELNKKFEGKDPMEKQSATMALYRQTGVNPFAGCIPVLIQMPVLYAMFRFFPAEIALRGQSFLWAEDLAAYDSILNLPFDVPFYGNHVSLFTLLMTASTFVYTRMSMSAQPTMTQPGMPNMNVMMNLFTFMMLFFFNSMPSGLTMYYFVANVMSIGQMWAIRKYFINEDDIRSKIEDNKKKPNKKSSFQQRLEEMQNAQKKKLEDQKKKLK
jgi:YidC/Oxa1 family membrane protein insertase